MALNSNQYNLQATLPVFRAHENFSENLSPPRLELYASLCLLCPAASPQYFGGGHHKSQI